MGIITDKKAFFDVAKLKTETVDLGAAGSVIVSELSADEFVELWTDEQFSTEDGGININKMTPYLIAKAVVDGSGKRVFSDSDAKKLQKINSTMFFAIAKVARELNGLGVIKNSEASLEDGGSLDSQES